MYFPFCDLLIYYTYDHLLITWNETMRVIHEAFFNILIFTLLYLMSRSNRLVSNNKGYQIMGSNPGKVIHYFRLLTKVIFLPRKDNTRELIYRWNGVMYLISWQQEGKQFGFYISCVNSQCCTSLVLSIPNVEINFWHLCCSQPFNSYFQCP